MVRDGQRDDRHAGRVVSFDEYVGLGEIESSDGGRYPFHCIELADGSRTINPGAAVQFSVLCKLGRYEAATISRS